MISPSAESSLSGSTWPLVSSSEVRARQLPNASAALPQHRFSLACFGHVHTSPGSAIGQGGRQSDLLSHVIHSILCGRAVAQDLQAPGPLQDCQLRDRLNLAAIPIYAEHLAGMFDLSVTPYAQLVAQNASDRTR
jgi:hypothetical protein